MKPKVLVSGFQYEYPLSRAVLSGSVSLCSDQFISESKDKSSGISANRQFCREMFEWVS